jgi:hypothetical protein
MERAALPLFAALVKRGANGVNAVASTGDLMLSAQLAASP